MGNRKYIYLAFFALFAGMYFNVHRRNETFAYKLPLSGDKTFAIVLYGDGVKPTDVSYIQKLMTSVYGVNAEVVHRDVEELQAVYEPSRKQYNMNSLMGRLETAVPSQYFRSLVLLDKDIFADGTNFVLGLGDQPGRIAAMTTHGYSCDILNIRLGAVLHKKIMRVLLIHEIGHTLGLPHCENKCVMVSGNNVIHEAKKYDQYCSSCEQKLANLTSSPYFL